MAEAFNAATRIPLVQLFNLPSCADGCYEPLALAPFKYACQAVSQNESLEACLIKTCFLPDAFIARNMTETACGTVGNDKSAQFFVVNIIFGLTAALIVVSRLGYRIFFSPRPGYLDVDDGLILAGVPIALASLVMLFLGLWRNGIGKDIWEISSEQLAKCGLYLFIAELLYLCLMTIIKLTLSVFYLEIFTGKNVRRLLWGTVIFHLAFGVTFLFKGAFQCTPVTYSWTRYDTNPESTARGHCININLTSWVHAAVNVAMDIWLIGIPLTQLKKLNLHWKKTVGAGFMFMTGLLVTIVSILRLNSIKKYALTTNPTEDQYAIVLWSSVEVSIGMICTCLPSVRLVLLRIWPRAFGTYVQPSSDDESTKITNRIESKYKSVASSVNRHEESKTDARGSIIQPRNTLQSPIRASWNFDVDTAYVPRPKGQVDE